MPDIAKKVTIDRQRHKVLIDGKEFPWLIAESGPEVEDIANRNAVPIVTIPIIAGDVEVIPERSEPSTVGETPRRDGLESSAQ